ncbi:50S ribosomal protein L19 [Symbiodinium microadriaticum]|uniref:50S ribosomal protein L19, chloroplastic n=1 Tax=Symbiodinium microadriaticum TaxID=2951 RepID=A0A1Q9F6N5_SYMMI|nr:50S ribosomal protein L19 [Symbiodinium microadriaticum]CAE7932749.1 rplS [Symbiodinium sp. KB8]
MLSSRHLVRCGAFWNALGTSSSLPTLGSCAIARRWLRERARPSRAGEKVFTVDSPVVGKQWPPMDQVGDPMTPQRCRDIMHQLHQQEIEKMRSQRSFPMPQIRPGDLVEVKYELSRSQQTFAVFQGFCVEVRNKFLNSGFVLKNTYDGVGVEQLVPRYSPRVLGVRVIQALKPRSANVDKRPFTRNYRYAWHYFVRGKYSWGKRLRWRFHTPQRPGIMSLEPKIRRELAAVRRRYQMQRKEARLPPYIFPGPYHVTRRQTREVSAERYRRMLIYAWDERQQREAKKKRLADKHRWGKFRIDKEPKTTALSDLPSYHALMENLPK